VAYTEAAAAAAVVLADYILEGAVVVDLVVAALAWRKNWS
jgi:hypothetical protein